MGQTMEVYIPKKYGYCFGESDDLVKDCTLLLDSYGYPGYEIAVSLCAFLKEDLAAELVLIQLRESSTLMHSLHERTVMFGVHSSLYNGNPHPCINCYSYGMCDHHEPDNYEVVIEWTEARQICQDLGWDYGSIEEFMVAHPYPLLDDVDDIDDVISLGFDDDFEYALMLGGDNFDDDDGIVWQ